MKSSRTATLSIAALAMVILILDTKTALSAALEGIDICLKAVVPSLFPFFFLSAIINDRLLGAKLTLLRPITRFCKIPEGSVSLLLIGLIGGYPVGAAGIHDAYRTGTLKKEQASRMIAFCNNAGPAFLFGMLSPIFGGIASICALWIIHIFSALIVAALTPNTDNSSTTISRAPSLTPAKAMQSSIRNMGCVCGWIVLFRVVIGFCDRWFLWLLPQPVQILLTGLLELSNGCLSLSGVTCQGLRFLYAAIFLSFGGICVSMQTASVIGNLSMKTYWVGKALQTAITFLFAGITQIFLFPNDHIELSVTLFSVAILIPLIFLLKKQ